MKPLVVQNDADLYLNHSADNNDGDNTTSNVNVATNRIGIATYDGGIWGVLEGKNMK